MERGRRLRDCLGGRIGDWMFSLLEEEQELSQQCFAALAAAPPRDEDFHADHHDLAEAVVAAVAAAVAASAVVASAANPDGYSCGLCEPWVECNYLDYWPHCFLLRYRRWQAAAHAKWKTIQR